MSILGFKVSRGKYEAHATNRCCTAMKRWTNCYNEHRRTGDVDHCAKRGGRLQDTERVVFVRVMNGWMFEGKVEIW